MELTVLLILTLAIVTIAIFALLGGSHRNCPGHVTGHCSHKTSGLCAPSFDLQLFSSKAKRVSDIKIEELSLVTKGYAPRNPEARVVATKAGEEGKPSGFLGKLLERATKGWLVNDGVPDNIDGDGDGAEDYEQIVGLITNLFYDVQSCWSIYDSEARSVAVCTAVDNFLENLDDVRGGGEGKVHKAGARHSKTDKAELKKMSDAHKAMGESLKALGADDADEGGETEEVQKARADLSAFAVGDVAEDGLPANFVEYSALCAKAKKKDDEPYGDVEYADPGYQEDGKKRYPLDTEEHVKAAASYFGKEKNRSEYTADQQKKIDAKIDAAKKKFGIDSESAKKGDAIDQAVLNAAVEAAVQKATAITEQKFQAKIDAIQTSATEQVNAAKAAQAAAEANANKVNEMLVSATAEARKATSTGGVTNTDVDGSTKSADGQPVKKTSPDLKGMTAKDATIAILASRN